MKAGTSFFKIAVLSLVLVVSFLPAHAKKWIIKVQNYTFVPFNLTHVKAGDTVKWTWVEGEHTTTSTDIPPDALDWDAPITQQDSVFQMRIIVKGTYNYVCTPHQAQGMTGTFTVTGDIGIPGNEDVPQITIYPNPVKDVATFSSQNVRVASLAIYDIRGQLCGTYEFRERLPLYSVDLGKFEDGIYLFAFRTDANATVVRRVVLTDR